MNSIVLRREIAVSIFERRWETSAPSALAVIRTSTEDCSGAVSGLGRPHETCWSASRSGSA